MNPELFETLDNLPADEPRSRLEPFREVILRWRRQGRSYRRIQTLLADHCSLQVSTSMLFKFVESRSRPRKRATEIEYQPAALSLLDPTTAGQTAGTGRHNKLSRAELARQRALLEALRDKPVVVPEVRKRFTYDPEEPLIIGRPWKEESE